LNEHATCEDKRGGVKDSFYEELACVFDQFPGYGMKILLGDFNAKVGRKNIFKPTIGNESLHEISNGNGVRVVKFATSKNLAVKTTIFPRRNFQKYNWNFLSETHTNRSITFQEREHGIQVYLMSEFQRG
jgi:hypothetical protein